MQFPHRFLAFALTLLVAFGKASADPPRYAIVDLGKDKYPIRIANNGWVLLAGSNPQAYYRWKAGVFEQLTYSPTNFGFYAVDMNNLGAVAGAVNFGNANVEQSAGLLWPANSSAGAKVSAPNAVQDFDQPPNHNPSTSIKSAWLSAINDQGLLYGSVYTGGGYVWTDLNLNADFIMNAYRWPANLGSPTQLSLSHPVTNIQDGYFNWAGAMDFISRANSTGHYIGASVIPGTPARSIRYSNLIITPRIDSGMIDSQAVSWYPVDIDEAGIVLGDSGDAPARITIGYSNGTQVFTTTSSAVAINDFVRRRVDLTPNPTPTATPAPQILGYVPDAVPTIWNKNADGSQYVASALPNVIPASAGWTLSQVIDLNDQGIILGYGQYKDPANAQSPVENHGFLLLPVQFIGAVLKSDETVYKDSEGKLVFARDLGGVIPQSGYLRMMGYLKWRARERSQFASQDDDNYGLKGILRSNKTHSVTDENAYIDPQVNLDRLIFRIKIPKIGTDVVPKLRVTPYVGENASPPIDFDVIPELAQNGSETGMMITKKSFLLFKDSNNQFEQADLNAITEYLPSDADTVPIKADKLMIAAGPLAGATFGKFASDHAPALFGCWRRTSPSARPHLRSIGSDFFVSNEWSTD